MKHVAFFGATGRTIFNSLCHALLDETIYCHVLIRDTDKLRALLISSMPDLEQEYSLRLRVVQGDVLGHDDVANVLFPPQTL
ncbi:hypothetical protein CGCTS75_v008485 [Colletotrichum tropicale]|nr:hypothetical protein CGCTS75_v008485 [Colletotrichum tropicale]